MTPGELLQRHESPFFKDIIIIIVIIIVFGGFCFVLIFLLLFIYLFKGLVRFYFGLLGLLFPWGLGC